VRSRVRDRVLAFVAMRFSFLSGALVSSIFALAAAGCGSNTAGDSGGVDGSTEDATSS
jgi:hypothetical protein